MNTDMITPSTSTVTRTFGTIIDSLKSNIDKGNSKSLRDTEKIISLVNVIEQRIIEEVKISSKLISILDKTSYKQKAYYTHVVNTHNSEIELEKKIFKDLLASLEIKDETFGISELDKLKIITHS